MKFGLLQISLFLAFSSSVFGQEYGLVEKVSKKCNVVSIEGLYGLEVNKKLVQQPQFPEYEAWNGLICFHTETGSVCWNSTGKKILEFNDAHIVTGESSFYLFASRGEAEQALFDQSGKEILPFGQYEFDTYENGILVKRKGGDQAFFDETGHMILPFSPSGIEVIDDYDLVLGVATNTHLKLLLNDNIYPVGDFLKVDDFTFASDHEVTVREYADFLISQSYNGILIDSAQGVSLEVWNLFPDTTKVEAKLLPFYRKLFFALINPESGESDEIWAHLPDGEGIELYTNFKLGKELIDLGKYPVTGVTKKQAEYYCEWLGIMGSENGNDAGYGAFPSYRLPSPKEWEHLAMQGLRYDRKDPNIPDSVTVNNCITFIYSTKNLCKNYASYLTASKGGGTIHSLNGPVDNENFYHVFGNVAEMTSESGVSKGGSYAQPAKEANLMNNIGYSGPQPWLGFRIIGEYHY